MITQKLLHKTFDYVDGNLLWKKTKKRNKEGNVLGTLHHSGYIVSTFKGKFQLLHRLIWLYHHGYLPKMLDHIDCDKTNNRIENLRVANASQNQYNTRLYTNNTSGVKGVGFHKHTQKWRAYISINKKYIHLGVFDRFEDAVNQVNKNRVNAHDQFARFQ